MAVLCHSNGEEARTLGPILRSHGNDEAVQRRQALSAMPKSTATVSALILTAILGRTATQWGLPFNGLNHPPRQGFKIALPH